MERASLWLRAINYNERHKMWISFSVNCSLVYQNKNLNLKDAVDNDLTQE